MQSSPLENNKHCCNRGFNYLLLWKIIILLPLLVQKYFCALNPWAYLFFSTDALLWNWDPFLCKQDWGKHIFYRLEVWSMFRKVICSRTAEVLNSQEWSCSVSCVKSCLMTYLRSLEIGCLTNRVAIETSYTNIFKHTLYVSAVLTMCSVVNRHLSQIIFVELWIFFSLVQLKWAVLS